MNNDLQAAQAATAEALPEMSLAAYRASRETPAEAPPAKVEAVNPPAGSENDLDESADESGTSDEIAENEGEGTVQEKPNVLKDGSSAAKKKGGYVRKLEAKDREIEELKRQLAAPAAVKTEATPAVATPEFKDRPKPKMDDFDSIEAFTENLSDWKADERDWKKEQTAAQAKAKTAADSLLSDWNTRTEAAKQEHADYDKVLKAVEDIKLSPAHQRILLESEHGPELAYLLAQDPDELKRIADLSPLAAARAIGKLEGGLADSEAPQTTTKVSSAPAPIRPVGARSNVAGRLNLATCSTAQYRKSRGLD